MRVELLGPIQAYANDATPVEVGGVRLRTLLARLALEGGRTVSVDALVDGLWGEDPPAAATNALQALVFRLRRALRGPAAVESASGGYRLAVRAEDVDVHRFEDLTARGCRPADSAPGRLSARVNVWADGPGRVEAPPPAGPRQRPVSPVSPVRPRSTGGASPGCGPPRCG
ncbi:AfsR/SARP family transcriptional regulator [Streptomyces antarcticus]|uniref:AfsR/SARP family transcriptional regulator n=1 Tax=Streptomyces antarcticus TaxID=2996458 RepID=UPI002D1E4A4C|nr:helix-turn-helix domain-containing protein [Streptomyces sp. H34-AA3]